MEKAYLYARVSTREQEKEGYSIPAQLDSMRKYARKHEFEISQEFVDVQTAKDPGRSDFEKLLNRLKRPKEGRIVVVEKMDRLARNDEDFLLLKQSKAEIHFIKTGAIFSPTAKAFVKYMHRVELANSILYSENLSEEVIKGMHKKAELGEYPGRRPFGYANNRRTRNIEPDPESSKIVKRMFELFETGKFSVKTLSQAIRDEFGKRICPANVHRILINPTYIGIFQWRENSYKGNYETFIMPSQFEAVQGILSGRGCRRPKYRTVSIPFRGIFNCHHCSCTITGERKKIKHVYYHCTGGKKPCPKPRFREAEISLRAGSILKAIQVPDGIATQVVESLEQESSRIREQQDDRRARLSQQADLIRRRMDQAYIDKADGKIGEEFWARLNSDLLAQEGRIEATLAALESEPNAEIVVGVKNILELAENAYSLYVSRNPDEQAELLRIVLSNCAIDELSVYPTFRKPFDLIFNRGKTKEWSGREDLNLRPPGPEADNEVLTH